MANPAEKRDIRGNVIKPHSVETESVSTDEASVNGTLNADSVSTELIGDGRHYAGAYDGADVDARLDNALSSASDGDQMLLEPAGYDANRTISKTLKVVGTAAGGDQTVGTRLRGEWTMTARSSLVDVNLDSAALSLGGREAKFRGGRLTNSTITVDADAVLISNTSSGEVVFTSGTSGGLVDSCTNVTVTDNGTNTVGDVT